MPDLFSRLVDAAAGMEALAVMLAAMDDEDIRRLPPSGLAVLLDMLREQVQACAEDTLSRAA